MAFVKLSRKEKWYIVEHPDVSPGRLALMLGNMFRDDNGGKRCALTVRLFRKSEMYKTMEEKNMAEKKEEDNK